MIWPGIFLGRLGAWTAAGLRSSLLRSSAGIGGLTGVEIALGLLTAILLARDLGAEGFGTYTLALAAVILAGLPVEFGLPNLVTREIARDSAGQESGVAKGVVIFAATVIGITSAVIVTVLLVFGDTLAAGLDRSLRPILPIAALLIPVSALCNVLGGALAGMQRVVIGNMPQKLVRPGVFALALGAALVLEPGWLTPTRAMVLQLIAATAALMFAGFCFIRHFADLLRRHDAQISWRTWTASMLRLGLSNSLRLGQGQILLLATGALSSVENVGLFRIAQRGAGLVGLGAMILVISSAPRVAKLDAEGQHARLQRLLTQIARGGAVVALAGIVCYAFSGPWLLATFFGAEFGAAWTALLILTVAETLRVAFGAGEMLMNMLRREGVTLRAFSIAVAITTLIAVALIPSYGASGAASGMFLGTTAMSVYFWREARRLLDLDPSIMGRSARRDGPVEGS